MRIFNLAYRIINGGDGSAYPRFHNTRQEAEEAEEKDVEEGKDGWGESSAGSLNLSIIDGRICRRERGKYIPRTGTFAVDEWIPLQELL